METLESLYERYCLCGWAISEHLPRLRGLASECGTVREFGVKRGASSVAFLRGVTEHVSSYDIEATPEALALKELAGDRWSYHIQSSLEAPVEPCDLLFLDAVHTFAHVWGELDRHAAAVRHLLVFHDTLTFGSVGADGETGRQLWDYGHHRGESVPVEALGIRPAIDRYMMRDSSWRIRSHALTSHGLLVLERR